MVCLRWLHSGPSHGSLLVLALRLSTRTSPSWLTSDFYINAKHFIQLVILTPGLFLVLASRFMYVNQAFRWSITRTKLALPSNHVNSRAMVSNPSQPVALYPSRLGRWRTDQWSLFSLLSFSSSSSPRAQETGGQLSSPQLPGRGLLCSSAFSYCSFPVSPLPCLHSDTVWLVLWPVTVLQGPCQSFVLRESAGLALFRYLTVPLLGSVPSCCRCFTLPALFAWFLWLYVVFAVLAGLLPH